jgi:outer membrane scaffolding protein for murein synthesis (MipA/OmpV family)
MTAPLAPAYADDPPADSTVPSSWFETASQQAAEWNVILGAGFRVEPKYEGAKDFKIMPVPMITADFGDYVSLDPMGLTINAWKYEGFSVRGRLGYDMGRNASDDNHLRGMGDISAAAVLGGELVYELMPLEFKFSVDKIMGGSDGLTAKLGTALMVPIDPFMVSIGPSVTWADDNYMESYFGVTEKQSLKSGLPYYEAKAGIKRVDLELSGLYFINDHWVLRGEVGLGYLVGDAADSPVTQEELQPFTMFILGYKF